MRLHLNVSGSLSTAYIHLYRRYVAQSFENFEKTPHNIRVIQVRFPGLHFTKRGQARYNTFNYVQILTIYA